VWLKQQSTCFASLKPRFQNPSPKEKKKKKESREERKKGKKEGRKEERKDERKKESPSPAILLVVSHVLILALRY
jgi:hypothetical protein